MLEDVRKIFSYQLKVGDECQLVDPMCTAVHYTAQLALQDNHALFIVFFLMQFSFSFNSLSDVYSYVISFIQHTYKSKWFKFVF